MLRSALKGDLPLINVFVVLIILAKLLLNTTFQPILNASLIFLSILSALGFIRLFSFYRLTVQMVFNKELPRLFSDNFFKSIYNYYILSRPMSMLYRYHTASFRVLPDVLVLGEVRCGTTSLCKHLTSLSGCHPPFCPWKHPELEKKETFYFVGHYGTVDPAKYSMCFPLKITRWFYTTILRRPFFTFDGCAQYLNSPTAPYLLAEAYIKAGKPPPILLACVRNPVDQAVSWWKYENSAIQWGESMGLKNNHDQLRSKLYPPKTFSSALDYSLSPSISSGYVAAEDLVRNKSHSQMSGLMLPPWSLTWPGGQLTGVGRSGNFNENILRFENVFNYKFMGGEGEFSNNPLRSSSNSSNSSKSSKNNGSNRQFVRVVNLEELNDSTALKDLLVFFCRELNLYWNSPQESTLTKLNVEFYVDKNAREKITRKYNAGGTEFDPSEADKAKARILFGNQQQQLEKLIKRKLNW